MSYFQLTLVSVLVSLENNELMVLFLLLFSNFFLQDVTTKLGCTESFSVVVAGTPRPEVQWLRDDKELKKGKRVLLEEEPALPTGTMYKVTIRDIVLKDFGQVSEALFAQGHLFKNLSSKWLTLCDNFQR